MSWEGFLPSLPDIQLRTIKKTSWKNTPRPALLTKRMFSSASQIPEKVSKADWGVLKKQKPWNQNMFLKKEHRHINMYTHKKKMVSTCINLIWVEVYMQGVTRCQRPQEESLLQTTTTRTSFLISSTSTRFRFKVTVHDAFAVDELHRLWQTWNVLLGRSSGCAIEATSFSCCL